METLEEAVLLLDDGDTVVWLLEFCDAVGELDWLLEETVAEEIPLEFVILVMRDDEDPDVDEGDRVDSVELFDWDVVGLIEDDEREFIDEDEIDKVMLI